MKISMINLAIGLCVLACAVATGMDGGPPRIDLARFALPGCPRNEVRFEEPRAVREVVVTFARQVPAEPGVSYLHRTWRKERQELLDGTINTFSLGWKHVDDWYDLDWDQGAVNAVDRGERTVTLRFDDLGKEGRAFQGPDVTYRVTHGIRVDGVPPEAIERIEVFTDSVVRTTRIRASFDAGTPTAARTVALSTYNCDVISIEGEAGSEPLDDHRVRLPAEAGTQRSFLAEIRHLTSPRANSKDAGLLTMDTGDDRFTISLDDLVAAGPIWYERGGVFMTPASDPTPFTTYHDDVMRRRRPPSSDDAAGLPRAPGSIAAMVSMLPEQTLAGATLGQPERQPVAMIVGCKYNRNRYRVETNGDVTMEGRVYGDQADRFSFGFGRWSRVANYTDPAPALVYHVERRHGSLRVHEEAFAVPLLEPVTAELEADDPTVCMLRFTFRNEGVEPVDAALPIGFSSRARHDRGPYQGSDRTADPAAPRDPLGLDDSLAGSRGSTPEWLVVVTRDGRSDVRGAVKTRMTVTEDGGSLTLRQTLAPGATCQADVRIVRQAVGTEREKRALLALDHDGLRAATVKFWNDQVTPWAELHTPEPELDAFHKAHLAHQMIADHRVPGGKGLVSTSVGVDVYGNFANESVMCIRELEERGLHAEARSRLELWLEHQGSVPLAGQFTDHEGVLFGSGGTEQGESYVQHHGWVMLGLAEHYFMTRDAAWLERHAAKLVQAADWVSRQRRQTVEDRPLSRGWERGLLPPGGLEDVQNFAYWTTSNVWTWRGLDRSAAALEAIGHPDADRIRVAADSYREDIVRSLTIARQHTPLVRLRDGRWVPHYPSQIYRRGRELGWIRETLEGAVNILLAGIIDPGSEEATWILDDLQDNLLVGGEFGYPIPEFHLLWFDWAGVSCQPNLLAGLMPYLDRDEIEVYVWMFFNAFRAAYSRDIQGVVEHPRPILGFSNAEPFKTSDESNSIRWLRSMFVYARGDLLHLGRAMPREWLRGGNEVFLKRVHVPGGIVSVTYRSDAGADRITCAADLQLHEAPGRILVRFRHPAKKRMHAVTVNGVSHAAFEPAKGDVDVTGLSGPVVIEATFGD